MVELAVVMQQVGSGMQYRSVVPPRVRYDYQHSTGARRAGPAEGAAGMAESVYRVTEVIGVSRESWEAAARNAVETAARTVRDLRVAEVVREDVTIENGAVSAYRVRLSLSFKFDPGS